MEKEEKGGSCDFSLEHYGEILDMAKSRYKISLFSEPPDSSARRIYLRHDIDMAVDKAIAVAELESRKGISSTYFVQLNSPFYNFLEAENIKIGRKIISLGHKFGLHFDHFFAGSNGLNVEEEISVQMDILRRYLPIEPVVSFHCPPKEIVGAQTDCGEGVVNTYGPVFFQKNEFLSYFSDSSGFWREGCVCEILKNGNFGNIQLLTHPIWWGRKREEGNDKLCRCLGEKIKRLDAETLKLVKDYKPFPFKEI